VLVLVLVQPAAAAAIAASKRTRGIAVRLFIVCPVLDLSPFVINL
jgi:hypothetical protein